VIVAVDVEYSSLVAADAEVGARAITSGSDFRMVLSASSCQISIGRLAPARRGCCQADIDLLGWACCCLVEMQLAIHGPSMARTYRPKASSVGDTVAATPA
jgi:hypothetical protein